VQLRAPPPNLERGTRLGAMKIAALLEVLTEAAPAAPLSPPERRERQCDSAPAAAPPSIEASDR
jgi:hypothetical protein